MVGFLPLLGVLFIALKLLGVVAWSWWWVLLPIYAPAILAALIIGVAVIAAAVLN